MDLLLQIKDFLSPKLESIRQEQSARRERLNAIDLHLVDQSRRIDALSQWIDETNKRIDKIQAGFIARIDETHRRLDRLYEVIVRRDDHEGLERWVREWAREVYRRLEALEHRAA